MVRIARCRHDMKELNLYYWGNKTDGIIKVTDYCRAIRDSLRWAVVLLLIILPYMVN